MQNNNPQPIKGILWMVLTGLLFVGVTAIVRITGPQVPAAEAAFLRYSIGLVFLLPLMRPLMRARPTVRQIKVFALRGAFHTVGVALWFYAMVHIPLQDVTAMNYLSPVYVTLGAALFLGEKLALRRILAIAVALVGVMIILRPGVREVGDGHLAMLIATMAFAGSFLTGKMVSDESDPALVVAMLSVTVAIGLAPLAALNWVTPTWTTLGLLTLTAFVATLGHYTMTLAFAAAPLTVTQPVTFLQLIWAVALGTTFFGEAFDLWVLVGGAVILGAISFMTWREAQINRRVTPTATATKV
ncbi:DMT family transporter [Litorivita sp. NS0012-18]|uniref:DMT family transporter n=1 Tax=Litorivita sp. NS0012-18 TaxID=3127655 RepID=UPI0031095392